MMCLLLFAGPNALVYEIWHDDFGTKPTKKKKMKETINIFLKKEKIKKIHWKEKKTFE